VAVLLSVMQVKTSPRIWWVKNVAPSEELTNVLSWSQHPEGRHEILLSAGSYPNTQLDVEQTVCGCVGCVQLVQDIDRWRAAVNTAVDLSVSQKVEIFYKVNGCWRTDWVQSNFAVIPCVYAMCNFANKRRSLGQYSSLADLGHRGFLIYGVGPNTLRYWTHCFSAYPWFFMNSSLYASSF
jgi:hypothetical protein